MNAGSPMPPIIAASRMSTPSCSTARPQVYQCVAHHDPAVTMPVTGSQVGQPSYAPLPTWAQD